MTPFAVFACVDATVAYYRTAVHMGVVGVFDGDDGGELGVVRQRFEHGTVGHAQDDVALQDEAAGFVGRAFLAHGVNQIGAVWNIDDTAAFFHDRINGFLDGGSVIRLPVTLGTIFRIFDVGDKVGGRLRYIFADFARRRRHGDVRPVTGRVFIMPGVVLISGAHGDFVSGIVFGQGVGAAVGTINRIAVAQPLVLHFISGEIVAVADSSGEGAAHFRFAADGNATRLIRRRCGVGDGVCSVTEQVFFMPCLVVVIHLHTDDFADIGGGDGIAAAVRAVDRRSVCQPGVLDAVRQTVAIANVRSQRLADGGCATQGDLALLVRTAVIATVHYGCGRTDDAFHFASAIGIGDAYADNFAAVIRCDGVGFAGCAADLLAGGHPLIADVADSTVAIADGGVQYFAGRGFAVDGGHATVVSRAGDVCRCRQVDVIGDDARIFGIKTDSAAGVGIFIIGKGGNHLAVDADFHGVAALRDDKIFGLRQRPAFAAGRHEALTTAVSRVAFAEFPAVGAGDKVVIVVVVAVIPHQPCRFPSIGCRTLAQLFRGGDGAAVSKFIACLHRTQYHRG